MMNGNDDLTQRDPDELKGPSAEDAYRAELTFKGRDLNGFSFVRQTAAVALGLRYGTLTDSDLRAYPNPKAKERRAMEESLEGLRKKVKRLKDKTKANEEIDSFEKAVAALKDEPEEVLLYDGLVYDAAIVLFLCEQPDSVCRRIRRKPGEYEAAVDKYADQNGITMNGPELAEATAVFSEIMSGLNQSKGQPKVPGEGASPDPN